MNLMRRLVSKLRPNAKINVLQRSFCSISKLGKNLGALPDDFLKHYSSFQLICYLRECQSLKILDFLPENESDPNLFISIEEIALQCNAKNKDNVYRSLRFLSLFGYTKQIKNPNNGEWVFVHTELSKQYARNPITQQPYNSWSYSACAMYAHPVATKIHTSIGEWILNDKVPFEDCFGVPLFGPNSFVEQTDNILSQTLVAAMFPFMSNVGLRTMNDLSDNFDFSKYGAICDVGGGMGQMCAPILQKYKNMESAIIFDTPNITEQARQASNALFGENVSKVEYISGDFFKTIDVPACDVYLLRWVLHDWNDELCHTIVANVRKAMDENQNSQKSEKRLLVVESLIKGVGEKMDVEDMFELNTLHYDMMLAVFINGKERTLDEYDYIMATAGNFKRIQVTPMSAWNLIEYIPVH